MKKNAAILIMILLSALLLASCTSGSDSEYDGPYYVTRDVDGDTLIVNIGGDNTRVRMIGIDTPESVSPDESRNCEEGKKASDYTKDQLEGEDVYLEYDVSEYDKYDRVLAYVYTENDGKYTMFNETLLKKGYARTMTIQPNVKYADHFYDLQKEARENNEGFWTTDPWDN